MEQLDEKVFCVHARAAQLPIGPPGATEFQASKLQTNSKRVGNPGVTGTTNVITAQALAPNEPGRDDTRHFEMDPGKFKQIYGGSPARTETCPPTRAPPS